MTDIIQLVLSAHENIRFFDPGRLRKNAIMFDGNTAEMFNTDYFNDVSFARYIGDPVITASSFKDYAPLVIADECLIKDGEDIYKNNQDSRAAAMLT